MLNMANIRTFYLRVNKGIILPVEVHALQPQVHGETHWFQDRHLQETVDIVKEAVESRLSLTKTAEKNAQQNSTIITGDSLRLGYVFKTRPGSQHCLVPSTCLTQKEQEDFQAGDLQSFTLAKEKLIIYACQRQVGSPQGMSQLVRVLGEKTHSASKGVSISSYFQKVSAHSASSSQSESSSLSSTAGTTLLKSGGKRNILKKITQKVDNNVSSKRQKSSKAASSRNSSSIQQFLHKEKDVEKTVHKSANKNERLNDNIEVSTVHNDGGINKVVKSSASVIKLDDQSDELRGSLPGSLEPIKYFTSADNSPSKENLASKESKHNIGTKSKGKQIEEGARNINLAEENLNRDQTTVRISQVCNASVPLSTLQSDHVGSVTLISVDQMNEIQQQKQETKELQNSGHSPVLLADVGSCDLLRDHSKLYVDTEDPNMSVLLSASFLSQPCDNLQSPFPEISKVKAKTENEPTNMKTLTTIPYIECDHLSDSADSPVFSRKKYEKQATSGDKNSVTDKLIDAYHEDSSQLKGAVTDEMDVEPKVQKRDEESKRQKRKLPNFSDSDSDHSDLPSISRKSRLKDKSKFVKLDEMKQKSRKFSISKSFFTSTDEKVQPTLSFFMGNKEKKNSIKHVADSDSKLNKDELENIDCSLIEELSFIANVKCERDSQIKTEIRELSEVNELNEEHLNFMVRHSEPYLRNIFEGKIHSSRHLAYKQGGKSKRDLNFESCLSQYAEEQVDTVMEALMGMFCKRHHKYLDYIMKVLLPEMLIKFHMEIHNLTKEESEEKLLP